MKRMLINVGEPEETRIAISEGGRLEEFYIESTRPGLHVGDIIKARVVNIEPAIQAAFLDCGEPRNAFLHVSEVMPGLTATSAHGQAAGKSRRRRPPIQKILRKGAEIPVQVSKGALGGKGPSVTTYISLPGRYLVLMPGISRRGISRKIEDPTTRERLKKLLAELQLPRDRGFIIRTAGASLTKQQVRRDSSYLLRLWHAVENRIKKASAPAVIYRESDLAIRAVRDLFAPEIKEIIIDSEPVYRRVRDFLKIVMPRYTRCARLYTDTSPLFHRYGLEEEIEKIYQREVKLPIGGSVVLESTEALVAVDVNSGKFRSEKDPELAALKVNLAAAEEIARQIRLRDLGGVIICDFIDLEKEEHRRRVERAFTEALKKDRARTRTLRISSFGIIEMTRQRLRPAVKTISYQNCPCCGGTGMVKAPESMGVSVLRQIKAQLAKPGLLALEIKVNPQVESYLQNHKRVELSQLEVTSAKKINILADSNLRIDDLQLTCHNK